MKYLSTWTKFYKFSNNPSATIPRIDFVHTGTKIASIDGVVFGIKMIVERLYGQNT